MLLFGYELTNTVLAMLAAALVAVVGLVWYMRSRENFENSIHRQYFENDQTQDQDQAQDRENFANNDTEEVPAPYPVDE